MVIGIIGAMDSEVKLIIEKFEKYERIIIGGYVFYKAEVNGNTCVLSKGGIGKTNIAICTALLISNFNPTMVINTGIAGGLSPLKKDDLVLANQLAYHDVDVVALGYEKGQIPGSPRFFATNQPSLIQVKKILHENSIDYKTGTVLTGDQFVTDKEVIKEFLTCDEIIACEMEGASVAHVCHQFCVSFVSLRFISDVIDSDSQVDDYQTFELETAKKSSEICYKILSNFHQ